jgi:hypothetical protein
MAHQRHVLNPRWAREEALTRFPGQEVLMDGKCRLSPHKGHYWVEEITESDRWECRWCGQIRHFNRERAEKAQMSGTTATADEYVSQQWLYHQTDRKASRRIGEGSLESDLSTYSLSSSG